MNALWKDDIWRTGARSWTDEQVSDICALKGRLSASKIGEMYGVSRGAICGVWFRARNAEARNYPAMLSERIADGVRS